MSKRLIEVHIMDQLALEPDQYSICINGVCVYKGRQKGKTEEDIILILVKLKEKIFGNIEYILNNQTIYYMVENLSMQYPYITRNIVPDVVSYSLLRQVVIHLLKDYRCTVSPLVLIIEAIENNIGITDTRELAGKAAVYIGDGFKLDNWLK